MPFLREKDGMLLIEGRFDEIFLPINRDPSRIRYQNQPVSLERVGTEWRLRGFVR